MYNFRRRRLDMVDRQVAARGVTDPRVLEAMRVVPREEFVPANLAEFAYEDAPLPIEEGQTISQPYIVGVMVEALELGPEDRVLEVGAGSGYAAAILGQVAGEVYGIERHDHLADLARQRMERLGYHNVRLRQGDGTLGWSDHAPFDAILVSAGGPDVPPSLLTQLAIGGRIVIPVSGDVRSQDLLLVRRISPERYERTFLGRVQFVPLIGSEGWAADGQLPPAGRRAPTVRPVPKHPPALGALVREASEPFTGIEEAELAPLLDRVGDARVVLIGEATHGTAEFYRMRARLTRELVACRGFSVLAIEGDWPDTTALDSYVRGKPRPALRQPAYTRFPTWMWRNQETREFVHWLKEYNETKRAPDRQVSVHGLDLYGLYNSIDLVLHYLDDVDPELAREARVRYGCLSPWEADPAVYGRVAVTGRMPDCEDEVVGALTRLLDRRFEYLSQNGDRFFDAEQNARVVRDAERYYRVMYYGARESWNLRDHHMFETLQAVLSHRGSDTRAVVWAHNSHVGDARATEMHVRGEENIGQLARERFGTEAYLIGFGTDHGTVAAADNWGDEIGFPSVVPSHPDSYERVCHESGVPAFLLPLRHPHRMEVREELLEMRLERAIGVIYRPRTELLSHYFQAVLPAQFDEYIWFDETEAVHPIGLHETVGMPETYPFTL